MFGVRSLTASRRSSPMSNLESHLTILRPTDSAPSDAISVFGALMGMEDGDHWSTRIRFISRTLCFCLGPGNIWRFPRQVFSFGSAGYVYLYIIYVFVFGTSLFVFEIGQSQYYSKGFAKLYTMCPVMEGIAFSMVFYCIMSSILYSMIGVYSFMYIFSSMYSHMKHSYCTEVKRKIGCSENSTDQTRSPEYLHFHHYIVLTEDVESSSVFNWRNLGILVLAFFLMCLTILFLTMKRRWVNTTCCAILVLTLVYSAFASVTAEGSGDGVKKMFVPDSTSVASLATWVYSIEQTLVSTGIGTGPLITFWSVSKMRLLSYRDCILMNAFVFVCSMLSALIFFSSAGIAAHRKNSTIEEYYTQSYGDLQTHVVVTEAFNEMKAGLSNVTVAVFYSLLALACFATLVEYVQVVLLFVNSFERVRKVKRTKVVVLVCIFFIMVTGVSTAEFGHSLMMSLDEVYIGTSALFIVCCETLTMSYLFGVRNLCDDVEFVLGFVPNYYYQITWLFLPSLLLMSFLVSVYLKIRDIKGNLDAVMIVMMVVTVVMPVVVTAGPKIFKAVKTKEYSKLFHPQIEMATDYDELRSRRPSLRR